MLSQAGHKVTRLAHGNKNSRGKKKNRRIEITLLATASLEK